LGKEPLTDAQESASTHQMGFAPDLAFASAKLG